jgi:hypothetical protein
MHLINRTAQSRSLELQFGKALERGPAPSPLIVFTSGSPRASFRALVSRFAWYSVPSAQRRLRRNDFPLGTENSVLQTSGITLTVETPLSEAIREVNDEILY